MGHFNIDPFMDTNGIKMLADQLERQIKGDLRKELTGRLVKKFLVEIEDDITDLVSRFSLDRVETMKDILSLREELRIFLAWKDDNGTYKLPTEYYNERND